MKRKTGKAIAAVGAAVAFIMAAAVLLGACTGASYPLEYEREIGQYAQENGLDPYFVAAVIYTESGFDSKAVSHAGAQGLMQIMPETAEWIAGKFGLDSYDIFDPETNIRFGCWYLGFLNERFGGDETLILAGYNAGQGRVAEWMEDSAYFDGQELHSIPFKETEDYVAKVEKAQKKYREQYPGVFE